MQFRTERDLEQYLLQNWWEIRDRLYCGRSYPFAYAMRSSQVQLSVGRADIVEMCFSKHGLLVTVHELKNVTAGVDAVSQVIRYMDVIENALMESTRCGWPSPIELFVTGIVVAPAFKSDAIRFAGETTTVDLRTFSTTRDDKVEFSVPEFDYSMPGEREDRLLDKIYEVMDKGEAVLKGVTGESTAHIELVH